MPTPVPQPIEREVPREVRYFTNGFVFRKFTLKERFLIVLGYNIGLECHIATEHKPGTTVPMVQVHVFPAKTLEVAQAELAKHAEAKKAKQEAAIAKSKATRSFTPPPLKEIQK